MTCIAARKYPHYTVISCDSRLTDSDTDVYYESLSKVVDRGNILIGLAGQIGVVRATLLCNEEAPYAASPVEDPYRWVWENLIPFFDSVPESIRDQTSALVVGGGKIMEMPSLHEVHEVRGQYWAIGTGAPYALGAFHAGSAPPEAVSAACYHSTSCGGEVYTYNV